MKRLLMCLAFYLLQLFFYNFSAIFTISGAFKKTQILPLIENHIVYDVHMFDSLSKFSITIYFCVFRITGSVMILR